MIKLSNRDELKCISFITLSQYKAGNLLLYAKKTLPFDIELTSKISEEISKKIIQTITNNPNIKNIKNIINELNYHKIFTIKNAKDEIINFYVIIGCSYSEDESFISFSSVGNLNDNYKNIIIEINEKYKPNDFLENDSYLNFILKSALLHEMAHVADIDLKEIYEDINKNIYYNQKIELRALLIQIIHELTSQFKNNEEIKKNKLEDILKNSENYQIAEEYLNEESKKYILQVLYNHFYNPKENKENDKK